MARTPNLNNNRTDTLTSNTTISNAYDAILLNPSSAFTITLFSAVGNTGKELKFKYVAASGSGVVTIDPNGSETIDSNYLTISLYEFGQEVTLKSDGANWKIISHVGLYKEKNYIINGNMDIWQRGTSITSLGTFKYTADRWQAYAGTNTSTVSQISSIGLNGSTYSIRHRRDDATSGTDVNRLGYALESVDSKNLISKPVSLSFYMRKGAGFSPASINVVIHANTGAENSALNISAGIASLSVVPTTSWVKYQVSGIMPSNLNQASITFITTACSGTASNDYFELAQVMLNEGSIAAPFSIAAGNGNIAGELALCQRYYEPLIAPASSGITGTRYTSTEARFYKKMSVPKRSTITITYPTVSAPTFTSSTFPGSTNTVSFFDFGATNYVTLSGTGTSMAINLINYNSNEVHLQFVFSGTGPSLSGTSGQTWIVESGTLVNSGLSSEL